jgi:acetyltransferase-like isoleucine patch superfamily enzyme
MDPRTLVKHAVNLGFRGGVAPLVLAYRAECALWPAGRRTQVFQAWSQALSSVPGLLGQYLRRGFYAAVLPACHEHSCIQWGTVFSSEDVRIAEGVYIGARCMIGRARLERHVTIGSNVDVLSGKRQHNFDDRTRPIQQQGGTYEPVTIGEASWLGNSSVVLADVGRGAIVAAGAVVVHAVPDDAIVAGNPARVVRTRGSSASADAGAADSAAAAPGSTGATARTPESRPQP